MQKEKKNQYFQVLNAYHSFIKKLTAIIIFCDALNIYLIFSIYSGKIK